MTQRQQSLLVCCVAVALTKAAYIAYVQYAATPSALSYADFWNAQDAAANSLGTLITDVTKLTTTSDSTALSAASAVAGQVITEQGITPLPGDPTVSTHPPLSVHLHHAHHVVDILGVG